MIKKGFVYLIHDSDNDMYKIGMTKKKLEKRMKELQTGNPDILILKNWHETYYPYTIENMLHKHFKNGNILNEWFSLSKEEIDTFSDTCKEMELRIDSLKENPFFQKYLH